MPQPSPRYGPGRSPIPGQLSIDGTTAPLPVRALDPDTSAAAASTATVEVHEHRSRVRADVLRLHQLAGRRGLTDDELAQLLPQDDKGTVVKRRCDLAHEGRLEDSGARRPTRRGRPAIVWTVAR